MTDKNLIVAKFGGSSMASAEQFKKVKKILDSNPARRFVVVSAPGKRNDTDVKVTDMLIECHRAATRGENFIPIFNAICERFNAIAEGLGITFDASYDFLNLKLHLSTYPDYNYVVSRGEYLNARLLATYLGLPFVDAKDLIIFDENGHCDEPSTYLAIREILKDKPSAVIPGFYGATREGRIRTFSRGGSDLSGSLVAVGTEATLYENWTDVSGMKATDPRIVENPKTIDFISYKELRELSYMGANVMHEAAVFPVRQANIPMNIRNTNSPEETGTIIGSSSYLKNLQATQTEGRIAGIAGKVGFSSILVEKHMMNIEVGFVYRTLEILSSRGISFEHLPSGIDTISIIVATKDIEGQEESIVEEIKKATKADSIEIRHGLSLICIVAEHIGTRHDIPQKIFAGLSKAQIKVKMIDQGASSLNIIIGVAEEDYETAIRAIYKEVF